MWRGAPFCRGASLIRIRHRPQDHHRALGIGACTMLRSSRATCAWRSAHSTRPLCRCLPTLGANVRVIHLERSACHAISSRGG